MSDRFKADTIKVSDDAANIAKNWLLDEKVKKIATGKKASVDPNDPRAQNVGMIKSLIYGNRSKMSDIKITIGDDTFDISDIQCECRIDPRMPPLPDQYIRPTWPIAVWQILLMSVKSEAIPRLNENAIEELEELLYLESPDESGTIKIPELKIAKRKKTYTNRETGKTYEADCVYEIPAKDRLRSAVYKRKVDNKKKKKLRKKNQKRNRKNK